MKHMCVKCEETVNCWLGEVDKRERRAMKKEFACRDDKKKEK